MTFHEDLAQDEPVAALVRRPKNDSGEAKRRLVKLFKKDVTLRGRHHSSWMVLESARLAAV
jgi:hypothetical protein